MRKSRVFISLFLCIALVISFVPTEVIANHSYQNLTYIPTYSGHVLGDVDGDGLVTMNDFYLVNDNLFRSAAEATLNGAPYADITGSGIIEVDDLIIVASQIGLTDVSVNPFIVTPRDSGLVRSVQVRHESVAGTTGVYRLVFAVQATEGFTSFNVGFSFDSDVIIPVYATNVSEDFVPEHANIANFGPLSLLVPAGTFFMDTGRWAIGAGSNEGRTAVQRGHLGIPAMGQGVHSSESTDLIAFYFRIADGFTHDDFDHLTFRLEDGREPNTMLGMTPDTLMSSSGMTMSVMTTPAQTQYTWGPVVTGGIQNFISDDSVSLTYPNSDVIRRFLQQIDIPNDPITGLPNGTPATIADMGLPSYVTLITNPALPDGNVAVIWDVAGSGYDPTYDGAQSFTIEGAITLPLGVRDPSGLAEDIVINVSVNAQPSLASVAYPAAITGLPNGTPATVTGFGLPLTVVLTLDDSTTRTVDVEWTLTGLSYDPSNLEAQTFNVTGTFALPSGVRNSTPTAHPLSFDVSITVDAAVALQSVAYPSPITGLPNGTPATVANFGLPSTITLTLDDSTTRTVDVTWTLTGLAYDPANTESQTFNVTGAFVLPAGVRNSTPTAHSLSFTVSVTVDAVVLAPTTVTVNPVTQSIQQDQSYQFAAVVLNQLGANYVNQGVTWTLSAGTITPGIGTNQVDGYVSITYNQPLGTLILTATSVANPSVSGFATITVTAMPPVATTVNVTPVAQNIQQGQSHQFVAAVLDQLGTSYANQGVTWALTAGTVAPGVGTSQINGNVSVANDQALGTIIITATSVANPSISASATITVTQPETLLTLTPPTDTTLPQTVPNEAAAIALLPSSISVTTTETTTSLNVGWAVSGFNAAAGATNTFTWTAELAGVLPGSVSTSGTIVVTNHTPVFGLNPGTVTIINANVHSVATTGDALGTIAIGTITPTNANISVVPTATGLDVSFAGTLPHAGAMDAITGTYTVTVVSEGVNATLSIILNIPAYVPSPPSITSADNTTVAHGTGGTFQVAVMGTSPITFELSNHPAGVSIDSVTGLITIAGEIAEGVYDFVIMATGAIPPNANQNFRLTVTPPAHTVNFVAGTGGSFAPSLPLTISVTSGAAIQVSQVPQPVPSSNYEFSGWTPSNPAGYVVTGDRTFTANFTAMQQPGPHAVIFAAGTNGTLAPAITPLGATVPHNTVITAANIPVPQPNAGFVFAGWIPNPLSHNVVAAITFTANWTAITQPTMRTVTIANGGFGASVTGGASHEVGSTVTINAGTRSGFTFAGWTFSPSVTFATGNNANQATTRFVLPNTNVVATANWSAIPTQPDNGGDGDNQNGGDSGNNQGQGGNQGPGVTPPPTPPPVTLPGIIEGSEGEGTVTLEVVVEIDEATVVINQEVIDSLIAEAGRFGDNPNLTINISEIDNATTVAFNVYAADALAYAGITVAIEFADAEIELSPQILSELAEERDGELLITVRIVAIPSDYYAVERGLPFLAVEVWITVGDEEITTAKAGFSVELCVDNFNLTQRNVHSVIAKLSDGTLIDGNIDLENRTFTLRPQTTGEFTIAYVNINRIVAVAEDGTILGGRLDTETGVFVFDTTDTFLLRYVDDLTRVMLVIGSTNVYDLADTMLPDHLREILEVLTTAPFIYQNRTFVPARAMGYLLGAEVHWNGDARIVTLTRNGQILSFAISEMLEGMDVPAMLVDGRTMVPFRFISEFFGEIVTWNDATRCVEIIR